MRKINLNKYSILTIISGVLCIIFVIFYFFNKLNINYIMLTMGLTQLFSGLSHIKTSENLNITEGYNGTKIIGFIISIIGILFILGASIEILLG